MNTITPAKDKYHQDCDVVCKNHTAATERDLCRLCPSKLSKRELENLYYALIENNLELKKTLHSQQDKLKTLSTKVQRMSAAQRNGAGKEKACCNNKVIVNEQKHIIADLTETNDRMTDRIKMLNMRLCSAKQFLKKTSSPPCTKCSKSAFAPATFKNSSMSALNAQPSEISVKGKKLVATSTQYISQDQPDTTTRSVGTDNDVPEKDNNSEKHCNENRCRTIMDELKEKIVNLQQELFLTHEEYSARISKLESDVSGLRGENSAVRARHAASQHELTQHEARADQLKGKLRGTEGQLSDLTMQLAIERNKVAELETSLKLSKMSNEKALTLKKVNELQADKSNVALSPLCNYCPMPDEIENKVEKKAGLKKKDAASGKKLKADKSNDRLSPLCFHCAMPADTENNVESDPGLKNSSAALDKKIQADKTNDRLSPLCFHCPMPGGTENDLELDLPEADKTNVPLSPLCNHCPMPENSAEIKPKLKKKDSALDKKIQAVKTNVPLSPLCNYCSMPDDTENQVKPESGSNKNVAALDKKIQADKTNVPPRSPLCNYCSMPDNTENKEPEPRLNENVAADNMNVPLSPLYYLGPLPDKTGNKVDMNKDGAVTLELPTLEKPNEEVKFSDDSGFTELNKSCETDCDKILEKNLEMLNRLSELQNEVDDLKIKAAGVEATRVRDPQSLITFKNYNEDTYDPGDSKSFVTDKSGVDIIEDNESAPPNKRVLKGSKQLDGIVMVKTENSRQQIATTLEEPVVKFERSEDQGQTSTNTEQNQISATRSWRDSLTHSEEQTSGVTEGKSTVVKQSTAKIGAPKPEEDTSKLKSPRQSPVHTIYPHNIADKFKKKSKFSKKESKESKKAEEMSVKLFHGKQISNSYNQIKTEKDKDVPPPFPAENVALKDDENKKSSYKSSEEGKIMADNLYMQKDTTAEIDLDNITGKKRSSDSKPSENNGTKDRRTSGTIRKALSFDVETAVKEAVTDTREGRLSMEKPIVGKREESDIRAIKTSTTNLEASAAATLGESQRPVGGDTKAAQANESLYTNLDECELCASHVTVCHCPARRDVINVFRTCSGTLNFHTISATQTKLRTCGCVVRQDRNSTATEVSGSQTTELQQRWAARGRRDSATGTSAPAVQDAAVVTAARPVADSATVTAPETATRTYTPLPNYSTFAPAAVPDATYTDVPPPTYSAAALPDHVVYADRPLPGCAKSNVPPAAEPGPESVPQAGGPACDSATYTCPAGEDRVTSPDNTDHEISSLSDLPPEKDVNNLSPGEEKAPTSTDYDTTRITEFGSLSDGELPTGGRVQTLSFGEQIKHRYSPPAPLAPANSNTDEMAQALRTISEELTRCKRLLAGRQESNEASLHEEPPEPTHELRRAIGTRRLPDTTSHNAMFTLHIGTLVLSDEAVLSSRDKSMMLTWKFYNQSVSMTRMRPGRVFIFDFSTEYDVVFNEDFVNYMKNTEMELSICDINSPDLPFASCLLPLRDALLHVNRRADMSLALITGPGMPASRRSDFMVTGDELGVLDLWCMLRAEPAALRAHSRPDRDTHLKTNLLQARYSDNGKKVPANACWSSYKGSSFIRDVEGKDIETDSDTAGSSKRYSRDSQTQKGFESKNVETDATNRYSCDSQTQKSYPSKVVESDYTPPYRSKRLSQIASRTSGMIVSEVPVNIKSSAEMKQALENNLSTRLSKMEDEISVAPVNLGSMKNLASEHRREMIQASKFTTDKEIPAYLQDMAETDNRFSAAARSSIVRQGITNKAKDREEAVTAKYKNITRGLNKCMDGSRKSVKYSSVGNDNTTPLNYPYNSSDNDSLEFRSDDGQIESLDITILWLALNEECEAMLNPQINRLFVAYSFLGRSGAEMETPVSLPKPKHYSEKCYFNFKKTFYLHDADLPLLGHMSRCRAGHAAHDPRDCIVFTVVSEPPEDPLGLTSCEDIGHAYLYLGDILAYSGGGGSSYTEVLPVHAARAVCGVLCVRLDQLHVLRRCLALAHAWRRASDRTAIPCNEDRLI